MANIREEILKLRIFPQAENAWEGTKYTPFTRKLVELDKVLEILEQNEIKEYNTGAERSGAI